MIAGLVYQLKVKRKTDIGYLLEDNEQEVFLHNNDCFGKTPIAGEVVEAFLFHDFKGRLAATLKLPIITLEKGAFLVAVEVVSNLGVFFDNGIDKHLLLSKDDLPNDRSEWPQKGDQLYLTLKGKNRLVAKRVFHLEPIKTDLREKEIVKGYVNNIKDEGIDVITLKEELIFIHKTQTRKKHRLGEKLNVTIMKVYQDSIHGTLIKQKEEMIELDANLILNYLKKHREMSLGNSSSPEEIFAQFNLSKKAFKRALGSLYKARLIDFKDNKTIYIGDKSE
ncbi:MAG: S1-like domain-containing RNA-binding protein [Acholeplasmatales bacterium]|nr:S1-like domain-containing RNA-binding protein [Acholeplasmataceae bacterium]MDY0114920.1 S1-like domain-containing RNA-binding protein [Acholeplasmatales bacterium]MCK9233820.1 S1-like domain-containing RNA-binding protein [Acholeplasmataceae bacterium]MCK9289515.1 S1-like domain-containing RNA-binding protein [Acholeplasmataceae bacterium]MCK9427139.1 S1-like domain-containing RNA-binding protein [Acholeplasmataceae bacterium]